MAEPYPICQLFNPALRILGTLNCQRVFQISCQFSAVHGSVLSVTSAAVQMDEDKFEPRSVCGQWGCSHRPPAS